MDNDSEKKGGGKKIIIIILLVVLVLGGAAAALRFLAPGLIPGWGEKQAAGPKTSGGGEGGAGMGELYPMQTFIVNLADPSGKRYLKLTLSLELDNPEMKTEVKTMTPRIRDSILLLLSSMTFEDISSIEGKMRLRDQIVSRCNTYLQMGTVKNVYFSEFVVQ